MRTPHRRRLAVAGAVLPIALLSLAACGSDDSGGSAADTSSPSASAEAGESPAEESSSPAASAEGGEEVDPAEFVAEFKAAFDKSSTAHLTMETAGEAAFSAEGDVDYSTTPPSMELTMSGAMAGEGLEMRLVDGTFYVSAPGAEDTFYSFDTQDPNNPLGGDLTKRLDPATAFDDFEEAITSVTLLGEEDVDGEQMRHYTVVVDGDKVAGPMGGGATAEMPGELAYDVWLDGEGLFRRMESDLGPAGQLRMSVDDWGKDVSIEAPPQDQVTTMPGVPSMSQGG